MSNKQRENMADVAAIQGRKPTASVAYGVDQIDGRTKQGRAVRQLIESFAAQLENGGPLSAAQAALVERAATLSVLAAETRRSALFNPALVDQAVRVENLASRALKALGLSARQKPTGGYDAVRQHIAAKAAAS